MWVSCICVSDFHREQSELKDLQLQLFYGPEFLETLVM